MNMFKRDKTPAVPPRPSKQDLDNPVEHSLIRPDVDADVTSDPKTKRTGVMGVMNKVNPFKSQVNKAASSESLEQPADATTPGSGGGFKGVMQKVNPLKWSSQGNSEVGKASSSESLEQPADATEKGGGGGFKGVMQKVNPLKWSSQGTAEVGKASSSESLEQPADATQQQGGGGGFKGVMQKVNPLKWSSQGTSEVGKASSSESLEQPADATQQQGGGGGFKGVMQKVNPLKWSSQGTSEVGKASSSESLEQPADATQQQSPGRFKGAMQKVNPFKSSSQAAPQKDPEVPAASRDQAGKQKSMFTGIKQKVNPFKSQTQAVQAEDSSSSEGEDDSAIERHTVWYTDAETQPLKPPKKRTMTFRVKKIAPTNWFRSGNKDSSPDAPPVPQEVVEVQTLELAEVPVPGEGELDPLDDEDGLVGWWKTVEGWDEWNEANQNDEPEDVVEQAADRVFMAARLFVRFFNQRGASLQQRILELLGLADAADIFHKKAVKASVGGGVASVAGSITTITGLVLAPFTAGASLIVTAVGIGVATAGGVASASANITDTVHSKTDRKKVEKMIQDYEAEIKDIKECLEFLQEGMEVLEDWDFEQYTESIAKKHLNQNVKHVMKEGGRAGKALVINTESLISTVQVLSAAGGAAKAVQVMSVTTGVMSGLFLALDLFFLAKDAKELKQGAKTDFAAKIREVCKDLQDGLLELNRIKEQLQKTIDGIEVTVDEEEEDEELLKSQLKKLVEFEE